GGRRSGRRRQSHWPEIQTLSGGERFGQCRNLGGADGYYLSSGVTLYDPTRTGGPSRPPVPFSGRNTHERSRQAESRGRSRRRTEAARGDGSAQGARARALGESPQARAVELGRHG